MDGPGRRSDRSWDVFVLLHGSRMDGPATRRHLIQLAARLVPVENLLAGGDRPGISAICTPNPQLASLINGVEDRIAQVLGRREPVLVRTIPVSYTHLRAHETDSYLVCR